MKENFKLIISILWNQIASLFFLLLVISSVVSFIFGEKLDGIIIAAISGINVVIGFFQEFKASKASQKLLKLVQTKIYVMRDGVLKQIPVEELVVGDIVHLVAGSIAPIDIHVIESQDAFIDESVRTGESMPRVVVMGEEIFAGATLSSGKVVGSVISLAQDSSFSKYREKLESVKKWNSFSIFTNKVIKYVFVFSLLALIVSMFLLVIVLGKYSLAQFFIFAIAMLVGVVPEMLPLIITLILTNESVKLSKDKVIVKRLSSLNGLASVQFLLTDKTGTITENKLKVATANDINKLWEASNAISEGDYERTPMDEVYDQAINASVGKIRTSAKTITIFEPFSNAKGYAMFTLESGDKVARGQIEKVLALCGNNIKHDSILKSAQNYEAKGMRVIALAEGRANEWAFSGFFAFHDPIKSSASASLKIAHERGVGVKILTGDSSAVAMSVAEELGLVKHADNIISLESTNVSDLSDKQLQRAVVFAKCTPENKLELINRYIKMGPVAFLGDGINDALALKRADVGIAVDNASDIAKESADILLLEKDLQPILASISVGRKALRNILTYIMYTLSGNVGTFFSLLVISFIYPVLPMLPIQILLNNLLTDLPLMLLITDNSDEYSLKHVPHYHPSKIIKRVVAFGVISSVFDFTYFFLYQGVSNVEFQTGWFVFSVLAELALVFSIRSSRSIFKSPGLSIPLAFAMLAASIMPFILIYNDTIAKIFKFSGLPFQTVATLFSIIIIYMISNEIAKYFMRKKDLYNKPSAYPQVFKA